MTIKMPEPLKDLVILMDALKHPELKDRVEALDRETMKLRKERLALVAERAKLRAFWRHEVTEGLDSVIRVLKDLAVFAIIWIGLLGVEWLTTTYPMHNDRLAGLLTSLHEATVLITYATLCVCVVWSLFADRFRLRNVVDWVGKQLAAWAKRRITAEKRAKAKKK